MSIPNLIVYVENVINKTKANIKYEAEQPLVSVLEADFADFLKKVSAASGRDADRILARNAQRKVVLRSLTKLVKTIDTNAEGNVQYILDAGIHEKKKTTRDYTPFFTPSIIKLKRGILTGTVEGEIKDIPKGMKEVRFRVSIDNGQLFEDHSFSTGKKFKLINLPVRQEVHIAAYFTGTHNRSSNLCDPVTIFVL